MLDDGIGRVRALLVRARIGLAVMSRPLPAALAGSLQFAGWICQLFAVYAAMRGFGIDEPLVAAGLVLLMMNVVTVVPFWPGNIGLVQAAVAVSLAQYGVAYARGFAFGIGLQLIEASVGIGIGTIFLAREGLSFASLREMETEAEEEFDSAGVGSRRGACRRLAVVGRKGLVSNRRSDVSAPRPFRAVPDPALADHGNATSCRDFGCCLLLFSRPGPALFRGLDNTIWDPGGAAYMFGTK